MKDFWKKYWFWCIILLLILIKQRLVTLLPLLPIYSIGEYDDLLMVRIADCLLGGNWPRQTLQLTKGIGFPVFLLAGIITGIGYSALVTLFHSIASLLMMLAVRRLITNKFMQLAFFTVLLFLPAAYILMQRVYRNSITIWQVLLVLASLFGMLLRLDDSPKRLFLWSLPGIVGLSWLFHTREDAVWCVCFAVGMLIVSLVFLVYSFSFKSKSYLVRGGILSLPLFFLALSIAVISALNLERNGFCGTTFFMTGSFPRMVKNIYRISWSDSSQLPPRVAVSRKQIRDLYNYSPSMMKKRDVIEKQLDIFSSPQGNGEVENGWIFWSMLKWADQDTLKAKDFFNTVSDELEQAVAEGKLQTRSVMPSALMAPWKDSAYPDFLRAVAKSWSRLLKSDKMYIYRGRSSEPLQGVRYLEDFTGRKFEHVSDIPNSIVLWQQFAIKVLDKVSGWYPKTAMVWNVLGLLGFLTIFVKICSPQAYDIKLAKTIFFLLGIAAACFVLTLGIAYTHATGFHAVDPAYLAGGYPMVYVFNLTAFFAALDIVIKFFRSKSKKNSAAESDN